MAKRDPDGTRQKILEAAFEEIHRNGFRSASVDDILKETGLTKGAFYHHFANKNALGYAVVDEVILDRVQEFWIAPLLKTDDPVAVLSEWFSNFPTDVVTVGCSKGCPLNNLAQEMSPIDETFRERIQSVYEIWTRRIAEAFLRGQGAGTVRDDIDPYQAASFTIASIEGCFGMAKNAQDPAILQTCFAGLIDYLESLRAPVATTTR